MKVFVNKQENFEIETSLATSGEKLKNFFFFPKEKKYIDNPEVIKVFVLLNLASILGKVE